MNAKDYRATVGPPALYDVIGAQQFCVLIDQGLRDTHYLLDLGCGSLRGGRLFIPYLQAGRYHGIEPNKDWVAEGFRQELGQDIRHVKEPRFDYNSQCDTGVFGVKFDFILAQSLFSHIPQWLIHQCYWSIANTLGPNGKFLFTFLQGQDDYQGREYTGRAYYTMDCMVNIAAEYGFTLEKLNYQHPRFQHWMKATHTQER